MVYARHRHSALEHLPSEMAESREIRNIQNDDELRLVEVPDGLGRLVDLADTRQEERIPVGERGGVGDDRADPLVREQVPQCNLTPGAVPICIHVRRQRDAHSRTKRFYDMSSSFAAGDWNWHLAVGDKRPLLHEAQDIRNRRKSERRKDSPQTRPLPTNSVNRILTGFVSMG